MSPKKDAKISAVPFPSEIGQLQAIGGSLQWLVGQLRFDIGYPVFALQGEARDPAVGSLLRGNYIIQ